MKITFLGQAGLLFQKGDYKIIVDPYLSDSVEKINPKNFRRQKINEEFLETRPDCLIFTHNHLDHYDPETVNHYLNEQSEVLVLCPSSVWEEVRKTGGKNNFVLFNRNTEWSEFGLHFRATRAVHSDKEAIGVIITDNDKRYYVTGDTLYSEEIFSDIPDDIFALFLPINGVGNNMNLTDAKRFSERVNPHKTIPIHFGMFDEISPETLREENWVIPKIWEEINL